MKLVKFALCLAILIALTKNGYSTDPAWKTLSDPDDNADEDAGGSLHVKSATLRASAQAFLTKRRTTGERMRYDVRSLHHCVKEVQVYPGNGNQLYEHYICHTHSTLCADHGYLRNRCEPSGYTYIPALKKTVTSGCKCKAD